MSRFSQPSRGDVESCAEASLMQDGRGGQQIGLRAVIESDADVRGSIRRSVRSFRKSQSAAHAQPLVSFGFQEIYLFAKLNLVQHVPRVAGFGIAKGPSRNLQLVIHQVGD